MAPSAIERAKARASNAKKAVVPVPHIYVPELYIYRLNPWDIPRPKKPEDESKG